MSGRPSKAATGREAVAVVYRYTMSTQCGDSVRRVRPHPNAVAWNPEVIIASSMACKSSSPSKSYPRTVGVPAGISTDLSNTASSAESGQVQGPPRGSSSC